MKNIETNTNTADNTMNPETWTEQDRWFLDTVRRFSDEQIELLMEIMDLMIGNPAREEFAMNWKGRMKDLPAALAQI